MWRGAPGNRKTRRGKHSKAGKRGKAAKERGEEPSKNRSASDVQEKRGKAKSGETSAGDSISQASAVKGAVTASDSNPSTPQKAFSPLQFLKSPLEPGSPLGVRKPASPLTTACVGLNLAKPLAAVARFGDPPSKTNVADAKKAMRETKGPAAAEVRREPANKSEGVVAQTKANSQKQGAKQRSGVSVARSGDSVTFHLSVPVGESRGKAPNQVATSVAKAPSSSADPTVKPAPAAQGRDDAPKGKRRRLAASSSSSDAAPPTAALQPVKKKINAGTAGNANSNRGSTSNPANGQPKKQPIAKQGKRSQPATAPKPKKIKYQMVVYKKHYMPSMRPHRDCWHGRVGV